MGAGHAHGSDDLEQVGPRSARASQAVVAAVVAAALATVVGLLVLWPSGTSEVVQGPLTGVELADATVTGVVPGPCAGVEDLQPTGCVDIEIDVTSGPTAGDAASFQFARGPTAVDLEAGDRIVVSYSEEAPAGQQYLFSDFDRDRPLLALLALFVVAVLGLGLWQGLRALIGAGVSLLVLIFWVLPALLDGTSPLAIALVGASAIALLALFLTHGLNHRTAVAYLGTVASLGLTAVIAQLYVGFTRLTGLADEEALFLQISADQVDLTGLLLAGIVIGSLGVLDDVTVTQVSAVWQLKAADGSRSARALYDSALVIGRDHIASTVNTLVLAYAGAALPLLLLFTQSEQSFAQILNGEVVAVEVVRALVGSIGLVASVPITTALAVAVIGRSDPAHTEESVEGGEQEHEEEYAEAGEVSDDPESEGDRPVDEETPSAEPEKDPPDWSDFGPDETTF